MRQFSVLPAIALALAGSHPALAQPAAQPAAAVEPAAVQALDRMRTFLRTLKSFEVRAQTTIQEPLDDDTKVDLLNHVRYEYRAPNKLFIDWDSDRTERRLYFDGKTATLFSPRLGYFAQVDAPGTVADMLRKAAQDYDVVFPLPDLFYFATSNTPAYDLREAHYIGPARIAGANLDHYLVRGADVDWQIWIEQGERPWPRKIVITDPTDPAQPSLTALLAWNPDVELSEDHFTFRPADGVRKIELTAASKERAQ